MRELFSWILPVKNEGESLPQLMKEIQNAMRGKSYEIIAVDDASEDVDSSRTGPAARVSQSRSSIASRNYSFLLHNHFLARKVKLALGPLAHVTRSTNFKIITFSTHQGKWAALREGIKAAKGNVIITSDSDLQDDPREVKKLLKTFKKGYHVVSGWRKKRFDPIYKVVISRLGNKLVSLLDLGHFHDLNSPFKVYRRKVLDALPKEGSLLRFSLLFAQQFGYKTIEVPIRHRPRKYGKSKFGLVKYLRIIYDLFLVYLLFSGSGRLKTVRD